MGAPRAASGTTDEHVTLQRGLRSGLGWRIAPILVALALVSLTTAVVSDAAQPRVILVGDSVTAGWGATDADHAWPAMLRLRAQVDAAPGAPSGAFLGRSWAAPTVVVELGINDYAQGVSPETYGDHMRRIVSSIRADRVIVIVPYRVGLAGSFPWDAYADRLWALSRRDSRVVLIDLRASFGAPTTALLTPDLVHPNDAGHELIARLVSQMVAP